MKSFDKQAKAWSIYQNSAFPNDSFRKIKSKILEFWVTFTALLTEPSGVNSGGKVEETKVHVSICLNEFYQLL